MEAGQIQCNMWVSSQYQNLQMNHCPILDHLNDEEFTSQLIRFMELIYSQQVMGSLSKAILMAINEIIREVIVDNSPCLMDLLSKLNYTILGHMYNYLSQVDPEDDLVLSIAEVLLAYDELDYPLAHRIEMSLYNMTERSLGWLSTKDESLHLLALIVIKKTFSDQRLYEGLSRGIKTSLATGLLDVIAQNDEFFIKHKKTILYILKFDDFKYHPYLEILKENNQLLKDTLNPDCDEKDEFISNLGDMSFYSADDDSFEDEQQQVEEIIELIDVETTRVPRNIYLHKSIGDEPLDTSISWSDWEKATYGEARSALRATQSTNLTTQTSGFETQTTNYKESQSSYWNTQASEI